MLAMIFEAIISIGLILVVLQVVLSVINKTYLGRSIKLLYMFFKLSLKATHDLLLFTYHVSNKEFSKYFKYVEEYYTQKSNDDLKTSKDTMNTTDEHYTKIIKVNFNKKL